MLYIKFNVQDLSKYRDFERLYEHMVEVRQSGFKFEEEEGPDFDWDSMTQAEVDDAVKKLSAFLDQPPEERRYLTLIPDYVNEFLEGYLQRDNERLGTLGIQEVLSIFNYLEVDFEVDMERLENVNEQSGIVEFSTGNYPFGGLERFLITLKAYGLTPTEYFDGFNICAIEWSSNFEYHTTELPETTKAYLNRG
tara:strand:+ start:58979 stop:59560 length:582 start_codon:yes stop_codon:yes gene_type:complete